MLLTVALFPARSPDGRELAEGITHFLHGLGHTVRAYDRYKEKVRQGDVIAAVTEHDVVIFDATRGGSSDNYDIAFLGLSHLAHVLVVSRNYLPVNFQGIERGGYPSFIDDTHDNTAILSWLRQEHRRIFVERSAAEKTSLQLTFDVASRRRSEINRARGEVFVSHRSRYQRSSLTPTGLRLRHSVLDLMERIRDGSYGDPNSAVFVPDGLFAFENEALAEQRRWQILTQIQHHYLQDCSQFWIHQAPDYFDSWWTVSELAVYLACCVHDGHEPDVRAYDPSTDVVTRLTLSDIPALTPFQLSQLAHCNQTSQHSYEQYAARGIGLRVLAVLSALGRTWPTRRVVRATYRWAMARARFETRREDHRFDGLPLGLGLDEAFSMMTSRPYQRFLKHTHSREFWFDPELILDRTVGGAGASQPTREDLSDAIKRCFDYSGHARVRLTTDDIDRGAATIGGRDWPVHQEKPRFRLVGACSSGDFLEPLPTLRLDKPEE